MRIRLHKLSDERHALELLGPCAQHERVECETRSLLRHDLAHFALEREVGTQRGVWGRLAGGLTLAELSDHSSAAAGQIADPELAAIEQVVGALQGAFGAIGAQEWLGGFLRYSAALGSTPPAWLSAQCVARVQEQMRQLLGRWKATPWGGYLELEW